MVLCFWYKISQGNCNGKNCFGLSSSPPFLKYVTFMPCELCSTSVPRHRADPSQDGALCPSQNDAPFELFAMLLKSINPNQERQGRNSSEGTGIFFSLQRSQDMYISPVNTLKSDFQLGSFLALMGCKSIHFC
jgi:hypothetical protein